MGFDFRLISHWRLDASVDEVAAVLDDPLSLTQWWAPVFMRGELAPNQSEVREGLLGRFYTKGLMPWTFRFVARVKKREANELLQIETCGDFDGACTIHRNVADERGLILTIDWCVNVMHPQLRPFIRIFPLVFELNHRWAMRCGRKGLQREILRRRAIKGATLPPAKIGRPTFPHNLPIFSQAGDVPQGPITWSD